MTRKSSGRMASLGHPNPIDVWIGSRIRARRIAAGISQERLAEALGLTFQQVQKYEHGANRISGSRIVDLATALGVAPGWFFEEIPAATLAESPAKLMGAIPTADISTDPAASREALELTRDYMALPEPVRMQIRRLVRVIARGSEAATAIKAKAGAFASKAA